MVGRSHVLTSLSVQEVSTDYKTYSGHDRMATRKEVKELGMR